MSWIGIKTGGSHTDDATVSFVIESDCNKEDLNGCLKDKQQNNASRLRITYKLYSPQKYGESNKGSLIKNAKI